MRQKFNQLVVDLIRKFGFSISKVDPVMKWDAEFQRIYQLCKPHTMTSEVKMYELYQSVCYVIDQDIPGDFVECGVWKGGSSMLIGLTLQMKGISNRKIYLYDTFEGMSEPTAEDVLLSDKTTHATSIFKRVICYAPYKVVQQNMDETGYPGNNIKLVKGKVEDTIPATISDQIALLRLDTDWYESTKHELEHLYPKLSTYGVLIIDDYGYWAGSRKAVDEYFNRRNIHLSGTSDGLRIGLKINH